MNDGAEFHFKNKTDLLKWFEVNRPAFYAEYLEAKGRIRTAGFSGSAQLLKREADEKVSGFLDVQTELNVANVLLKKEVGSLSYEPAALDRKVDFTFEDVAISVKNLHPKDYEKKEQEKMKELEAKGGGAHTFAHRGTSYSSARIEVDKNEMGTYTWSRTETGHGGILDSDLAQMSPPLKWLHDFEGVGTGELKKVLFVEIYTGDFAHSHARDIGYWYYGLPEGYIPIFANDMSWYKKLFGENAKSGDIDAIVFMWPPNPLIWPSGMASEIVNEKERMLFFGKDAAFIERLKTIFS